MNAEAMGLLGSAGDRPGPKAWEPVWSKYLAAKLGGVAEYRCIDGSRVDVLTDDFAAEVEWVKKWKESIGQALLYSLLTGRAPMVILLLRGHDHERKYLDRCRMVCVRADIELRTESTVPRAVSDGLKNWRSSKEVPKQPISSPRTFRAG